MTASCVIGLLNNAALLLAMGVLYDALVTRPIGGKPTLEQIFTGVILSAIGIAVMSTHWEVMPGVVFDTRSVLLCISGVFFGVVPTLTAVLITGAFRLHLGGAGAWTGVIVIAVSGGIGLAWRHLRRGKTSPIAMRELFLLGIVVHITMLLCMLTLPLPKALEVLSKTSLPVLVIFPLGTALLGKLMVSGNMRKEAVKKLLDSENRFRGAFEQSAVGMAQLKISGRFIRLNERLCDIMGYPPGELTGRNILDITDPADVESIRKHVVRALEEPGKIISKETRFIRKDGDCVWGKVSSSVIRDETGAPQYFAVVVEDITESKKRDEALKEALAASHQSEREIKAVALRSLQDREALAASEQRMSAIVNAMPAMLNAFDEKGDIIFWNAECERVTGHQAKEVINHPEIMNKFYPDENKRQRVHQSLTSQSGAFKALEFEITCKDGSTRSILWSNISGTAPISGWAAWAIGIDVTTQKKAEKAKEQLEARLLQLQKIEAIGALAGGIAHDFNNILYPILGFAELMEEDLPPDSPFRMNVREIITGANRARDLVKQILTFSRQANQELMPITPQLIVKEAVKLARSTLPRTIAIEQHIDPNADLVLADPTQIHHIVMHLITNAYHAMQELGGILKVTLHNIGIAEENAAYADLSPGPYVKLSIADTGVGISRVILDRIFDPYFSTKPKDKGTGLGLSVVFGIVKSYHGDIVVRSTPGEGTTVDVYFPAIKAVPETAAMEVMAHPGGDERILLVEDEEQILRLEKQMLERLGYEVSAFTSGVEALNKFKVDPAAFDLVITDMAMPNMTGERLNQELAMIRRDLPVILCTGFSEYMTREKAEAFGIKGFLMKPVVKSELARTVRNALDDSRKGN
jgi:two-component system, cell cycle sensor histidine kinase and response regulator CckA